MNNIKFFIKAVFYIVGTLLIIFLAIVIAVNFINDARILHS